MERDLDEEAGQNQNNFGDAQQNDEVPQTKNFKTDESLGMDGIDVVLENHDVQQPSNAASPYNRNQAGANEESKERQPS